MSYQMYQNDSNFMICKEHFPAIITAATQKFPGTFDAMSSVRDVFKQFCFSVECNENGHLTEIEFTGEKSRNEDALFRLIAPFVEPGSYISFVGEDDEFFRFSFDGTTCMTVYPLMVWPEIPEALKEGEHQYILPFSLSGELMLSAPSDKEAQSIAEDWSVEKFFSHLRTLFEKDIHAYLQIDQMRQVEE